MLMSFDLLEKALKKNMAEGSLQDQQSRRQPSEREARGDRLRTPMHQNCLHWGGMEGKFHRAEREKNISPAYVTRARVPWKMPTPALLISFFSNRNHSTEELSVVFVCLSVCFLVLYCHAMREWLRSEQPGKNVCDGSPVRKILDKSGSACEWRVKKRKKGRVEEKHPAHHNALRLWKWKTPSEECWVVGITGCPCSQGKEALQRHNNEYSWSRWDQRMYE